MGLLDHFLRAGSFIKKDLIFDSDLELSFLLLYVEHKIAMNKSEIESHIYIYLDTPIQAGWRKATASHESSQVLSVSHCCVKV